MHENKYTYSAFGFTIQSDIIIPAFITTEGEADVRIILGSVPDSIENAVYSNMELKVSEKEFLFLHSEADYYIKGGNTVIVNIHGSVKETITKGFLTGMVMGAILYQRGLIPIHGSAIKMNGKGYIFTGSSGAGKSTICAALRRYNYGYLSDDITAVDFKDSNMPAVLPSFPQQRLNNSVAIGLGLKTRKLAKSDDKYIIRDCSDFINSPVPLGGIIKLQPEERRNVELEQVTGSDKLKALIENLYFSEVFMKAAGKEFFLKLSRLAKALTWYNLRKPARKYTLRTQIKKLLDTIQAS